MSVTAIVWVGGETLAIEHTDGGSALDGDAFSEAADEEEKVTIVNAWLAEVGYDTEVWAEVAGGIAVVHYGPPPPAEEE